MVLDTPGDDNVGDVSLGVDIFLEVWLHEAEPLFDNAFDIAASLFLVTQYCFDVRGSLHLSVAHKSRV